MKQKLIDYFYKVAELTAELSTCIAHQVGAVLVKDGRIVAIGYNGTPPGVIHCNEIRWKDIGKSRHHIWSKDNELHAEQNLISFCAKNGLSTKGCHMFVTLSPCTECAKLILASGIQSVYFIEMYNKPELTGLNFLRENGVSVNQKG